MFRYHHGERPLEGYTILRGIGRGGFGEVYYAVSDGGREVALKVIQQNHDIELRGVRQCINLKSPHLISIFDVKKNADGIPFVIMEYVAGVSIRDLLREAPQGLGIDKSLFLIREICKGLSYLHERGIVHRDLKPENIFYEDSYVKIGDYGLSKYISMSRHSGQTISVGTVHYMAPEIGSGNYTHGIDIYSLGIVLFELLTGNVPFDGDSMGEILMKHLTCEPDLSPLPPEFRPIVAKALAKNPKDRYASAKEMMDSLLSTGDVAQRLSGFSPVTLTSTPVLRPVPEEPPPLERAIPPAFERPPFETPPFERVAPQRARRVAPPPLPAVPATRDRKDPRRKDIEQRIVQGAATTLAMAIALGLFEGGHNPLQRMWNYVAMIAVTSGGICAVESWLVPRFQIATGVIRRLATFGFVAPLVSMAFGIFQMTQWLPVVFAGLVLLDWTARTKPDRLQRADLGLVFHAALLGLAAAALFEVRPSPLLGAGVLAAMSLGVSAFAPFVSEMEAARKLRAQAAGPARIAPEPPLSPNNAPPFPNNAPGPASPPAGGPGSAGQKFSSSRLVRPLDDRVVAGVASGLARRYGWEVVWIRALFLLLTLVAGWGVLLYGVMWVCMPEETRPKVPGRRWGYVVARILFALLSIGAFGFAIVCIAHPPPISGDQDLNTLVSAGTFGVMGSLMLILAIAFKPRRPRMPDSRETASSAGWKALGAILILLSLVTVAIGTTCACGLGEQLFREAGFRLDPGLFSFGTHGEHLVIGLCLFVPGVSCLLFARRHGGIGHVLRGAIGWIVLGILVGILARAMPEMVRVYPNFQPGQRWDGVAKLSVFILVLGTVSALCLAWPRRRRETRDAGFNILEEKGAT